MIHRHLVSGAAALLGSLAFAAEARPAVNVNLFEDVFAITSDFPIGNEPEFEYSFVMENILPGAVRVRQQAFGDPALTSSTCNVNPVFNDVVCPGALFDIDVVAINLGLRRDRVRFQQNRDQSPCPVSTPVWAIEVNLLAGDDILDTVVAGTPRDCIGSGGTFEYALDVEGGEGRDTIDAKLASGAVVSGGSDDDVLRGSGAGDRLSGGGGGDAMAGRDVGDDTLTGGPGVDLLAGTGGDDVLDGGTNTDSYDGGAGTDTVTYASLAGPVVASISDDALGDGEVGQAERIPGTIENLTGSPGADTLHGDGDDNDLRGGPGGDTIRAFGGDDRLFGDEGDDNLLSQGDLRADDVDCGPGNDSATVDLIDRVPPATIDPLTGRRDPGASCENLLRFAADDGPPARVLGRRARVTGRGRRIALIVACPRRARVACRGRVTVRDPDTLLVLARARYAVALGGRAAVPVTARRRLPARVSAELREPGVSELGPRSSSRLLRVLA